MKYFVAMYDEEDFPYMIFEDYKEAAKFLETTRKVIACNICRHQPKKYKGKEYRLHKIYIEDKEEQKIYKKNIRIKNIKDFVIMLKEIEKTI